MKDELIMNNLGLVHRVIRDMNCVYKNQDEYDQYYYAGLFALINSLKTYDAKKGKSTYLYKAIKNAIFNEYRKNTAQKRQIKAISLNIIINGVELEDIIPSNYNLEKEVLKRIELEKCLSILKNKRYKTFLLEYYGINTPQLNMREIAEKYGVSHQFVNERIKFAIEKMREEIE